MALDAQTAPTVLIVGGLDKGNDYTTLHDLVQHKCRALVYLGADNAKLHEAFDALAEANGIAIADTHNMADCVGRLPTLGPNRRHLCLLSPWSVPRFDLFKNMEDRGEQFKNLVRGA